MSSSEPKVERRPTIIRLKRKREDDSADLLVLQTEEAPPTKRVAGSVAELSSDVSQVNLEANSSAVNKDSSLIRPTVKKLVFRRLDTVTESAARAKDYSKKLLDKVAESVFTGATKTAKRSDKVAPAHSEETAIAATLDRSRATAQHRSVSARQSKRSAARAVAGRGLDAGESVHDGADHMRSYFKLFDVVAQGGRGASVSASSSSSSDAGVSGATLIRRRAGLRPQTGSDHRVTFVPLTAPNPGRILNPFQRSMDEAVWRAFKFDDYTGVFSSLRLHGIDANYQRVQSDLTTPLMAAAYHGQTSVAAALIRCGALVRIPDASGSTALAIALGRGHGGTAALLRDVLAEEEEEIAEWGREMAGAAAVRRGPHSSSLDSSSASSSSHSSVNVEKEKDGFEYDVYMLVEGDEAAGEGNRESAAAETPAGGSDSSMATDQDADAPIAPSSTTATSGPFGAGSTSSGRITQILLDPLAYSSLSAAAGGDGGDEGDEVEWVMDGEEGDE